MKTLWKKLIESRKAVFTGVALVFWSIALWFGKMTDSVYLEAVKWILGVWLVGQSAVDAVAVWRQNDK